MFKKDKKDKALDAFETFFLKPKPKSYKKRTALIGLGSAAAVIAIAGVAVKNQDQP